MPASPAPDPAQPSGTNPSELAKKLEGIVYEDFDPLLLKQNEGLQKLEFETYDAALDEFYARVMLSWHIQLLICFVSICFSSECQHAFTATDSAATNMSHAFSQTNRFLAWPVLHHSRHDVHKEAVIPSEAGGTWQPLHISLTTRGNS
jgi:hypothetical protein